MMKRDFFVLFGYWPPAATNIEEIVGLRPQ